jgi:hypothetical protein
MLLMLAVLEVDRLITNQTFPSFCDARVRLNGAAGQAQMSKTQFGQCSMSKTRLSSLAQLRRADAPCVGVIGCLLYRWWK